MRMITALAAASISLLASAASASTIEVRDAYIPAPPPGAPTAAGYAVVANHGLSDRLTGGRTAVASSVELHEMSNTGGIMRMRPMPGGLAIGASTTVKLSPDRYHLMLIGLKAPLRPGQQVKVVLHFQRAGDVPVEFAVRPPQAAGGMAGMRM